MNNRVYDFKYFRDYFFVVGKIILIYLIDGEWNFLLIILESFWLGEWVV